MADELITTDILLQAYAAGLFPMSESADDPGLFWVEPKERGIIPLEGFHIPARLARTVAADAFEIRADNDFQAVIDGCAAPATGREETWINRRIRALYGELFEQGHCHTIEAWCNGQLVGGLYGLALGGAFFGESMFHHARDASKVALVHLIARLRAGGFQLLDTQFVTPHLAKFGAVAIPRRAYMKELAAALSVGAQWWAWPRTQTMTGSDALKVLGYRQDMDDAASR